MLTIFFFYGLAFIILALTIFLALKRRDFFDLENYFWSIGLFGLLQGLNEWIALFILKGKPFNIGALRIIGSILLPLSFLFLVVFGISVLSREYKKQRWLNSLYLILPILWFFISIYTRDVAISEIFTRYLICIPGAFLTAFALYIALKKSERKDIPQTIRSFAMITAGIFVLYGIFSGLITPRADFFPAKFFNYYNFMSTFGLPVQFFRMLCAIGLTISFMGIFGIFLKQKVITKSTIRRKITVIIFLAVSIVAATGIALMYFVGLNMLSNTMGRQYVKTSELLGDYVVNDFNAEIENATVYATLPLWVYIIRDANLKYERMNAEEKELYFKVMGKKWILAEKGEPLFWEYLENRVSIAMRDMVKIRGNLFELFITDKYGGIVAASGRTADFYQADTKWWQMSYNNGKGDIYVSDIQYDESFANWVIIIAVPIKDTDGSIMGICKTTLSVQRLFGDLTNFKIGKTGHAFLTDNKGRIIYLRGMSSMYEELFTEKEMDKILSKQKHFTVVFKKLLHWKEVFIAFSEIKPPYLSEKGIKWVIFIAQDILEISEPLDNFIIRLGIIACCLIVLTIPVGSFFGNMVAEPIRNLQMATERVMEGDWNYKIEVKTGDEIEQFADTFSAMIANIKDKQIKLESFSKNLELKIKERTKELSEAQEATLNILEDLRDAKDNLERTNKVLKQLDQLKSDFISTVSHELRTPLSIIKEGVSLVLDKIPGNINEKQQKILDISKFNIDRLARIIDSLLDISKIEAGKVELKCSLINIANIAKEVASSFAMKIKEKGLELRLDISDDAGKVYADPDRIAQVFINLIGNAIKFTSSGYIEVSCKNRGDTVACSVKDTGIGMLKSDLSRIFDKFQQFGRIAGGGEKGTGLGLSIAKGIIDMHNGLISAESEPAMGSRFTFVLHKYTEESLFSEFTNKAIKQAAQSKSRLSIVMISSKDKEGSKDTNWLKNFHLAMNDCSGLIKNTLRRQGDEIVSNNGDMLVILVNCNKEHSLVVQQRLEQILNKSLEEKKIRDKLDMQYGCATFPDDGKTNVDLINKARSGVCIGRLNKA